MNLKWLEIAFFSLLSGFILFQIVHFAVHRIFHKYFEEAQDRKLDRSLERQIAVQMREGKHWRRLRLYLYQGMFYLVFGFAWDLYRVESLRTALLLNGLNYLPYRLGVLLLALGHVIVELVSSIKALLHTPK